MRIWTSRRTQARLRGRIQVALGLTAVAVTTCVAGCSSSATTASTGSAKASTSSKASGPIDPFGAPTHTAVASSGPVLPDFGAMNSGANGSTPSDLTKIPLTLSRSDGTTIGGTLALAKIARAGSSEVDRTWAEVGGTSTQACEADDSRDGVFVGQLSLTNRTPSFSPQLSLQFRSVATETNYLFGVQTSSESTCQDFYKYPNYGEVQPDLSTADWGPVPIEIVVPNYYSPSAPDGNPSLFGNQSFYFEAVAPGGSGSGHFQVASSSKLLQAQNVGIVGLGYLQLVGLS